MGKNAFGMPSKQDMPVAKPTKAQLMDARRLLLAEKADPLIKKTIDIALDDDHPGQMAAMKMCMDRLLPMSEFEARKDGARTAISITISGIGEKPVIDNDDGVETV